MRILTTAVFLTILVECCFGFVDMPWGKLRDKNGSSYYSSRTDDNGCEVPLIFNKRGISVCDGDTMKPVEHISREKSGIISCTGPEPKLPAYTYKEDSFPYSRTNVIRNKKLKVKCDGNNMLEDEDDKQADKARFSMLSIECVRNPYARYTGEQCIGNYDFIEIAPLNEENGKNNQFGATQIKICYDRKTMRTLYAKHTITATEIPTENELFKSKPRPMFEQGIFFCNIKDVLQYYSKITQQEIVNCLLGAPPGSDMYIHNKNDKFFLSKGHLAPNGDFPEEQQKLGTYYLVNAAPQWQTINSGNWNKMENSLRKMKNDIIKQEIVTGTYGTLEFIHYVTGELTPIYLYPDDTNGKIPVPKYFWKAFKLTSTPTPKRRPVCPTKETPTSTLTSTPTDVMKGYVIVTANNPYCLEEKICTTGTDKLEYLELFGITDNSIEQGYTFICTFEEFTSATKIDVNALFT